MPPSNALFQYYRLGYTVLVTFHAYIDNIYTKTDKTPQDFLAAAKAKGVTEPDVKTMQIVNWPKTNYGLGHGHAMAIVLTFKQAGAIPNSSKK